jgi:hypothetical protein
VLAHFCHTCTRMHKHTHPHHTCTHTHTEDEPHLCRYMPAPHAAHVSHVPADMPEHSALYCPEGHSAHALQKCDMVIQRKWSEGMCALSHVSSSPHALGRR